MRWGFFGPKGGLGFGIAVSTVGLTMALEQGLHDGVDIVGLVDAVGPRAAALFGRVGAQLDAAYVNPLANISRPIKPCASHTSRACLKTWPIR